VSALTDGPSRCATLSVTKPPPVKVRLPSELQNFSSKAPCVDANQNGKEEQRSARQGFLAAAEAGNWSRV